VRWSWDWSSSSGNCSTTPKSGAILLPPNETEQQVAKCTGSVSSHTRRLFCLNSGGGLSASLSCRPVNGCGKGNWTGEAVYHAGQCSTVPNQDGVPTPMWGQCCF
jgi:hypothetical protein